mgnify:FL=1
MMRPYMVHRRDALAVSGPKQAAHLAGRDKFHNRAAIRSTTNPFCSRHGERLDTSALSAVDEKKPGEPGF